MTVPDNLSDCLVLNTISAARALLRRFDRQLKPYGVTVQQFALLAAVRSHPGVPVMTLAEHVLLDRTSLTRNLDVLERAGHVRRVPSKSGNARICELTPQGEVALERLMPEWNRIGAALDADISPQDRDTYRRVAKRLAQGCSLSE